MFRRFIVALGCSAVLSACADTAVAPTAVPASPTPVAAVPKSAVGNKLPGFGVAFLPLNENRCEERTAVTDASGKIVAWTRTPSQVTPRFAGPTSEVSAYSILTFSARSHQQTSQFDCVLQSGSQALPFMKAQLATRHAPAAVRTLGGTIGYSLGGDTGTCEWDGWGLTCEGDACVRGYAAMRATGARSTAPVPGPAARIEMGALGAWHCGSCNVFISESGSVFNCGDDDPPEDGGDEGGGGGGCGGGGLLFAICEPGEPPLAIQPCSITDVNIDDYLEVGEGGLTYDPIAAAVSAAAPCLVELAARYKAWVMSKADSKKCHGNALCLQLYSNYFDGHGADYEFTSTEFNSIKSYACTFNIVTALPFSIGQSAFYRQSCSFYNTPWDPVLGTATIAYQNDPVGASVVGVFDRYNMDFRIRRKANGNVDISNIISTMAAATLPMLVAAPAAFTVHYGVVDPGMP